MLPLLDPPMVELVDSEPDIIDLTSSSDGSDTESSIESNLKDNLNNKVQSHVVEHVDMMKDNINIQKDKLSSYSVNTNDVKNDISKSSALNDNFQNNTDSNKSQDIEALDNFFEGKIRSIGVEKHNRLPVENALNEKRNIDNNINEKNVPLNVPQSTQSIESSSNSKKESSNFISGIYNGINKVRNLFLSNSIFSQDEDEDEVGEAEGEKEEEEEQQQGENQDEEVQNGYTQPLSITQFKLPRTTASSTQHTNTSISQVDSQDDRTQYFNKVPFEIQQTQDISTEIITDSTNTTSDRSRQSQSQSQSISEVLFTTSRSNQNFKNHINERKEDLITSHIDSSGKKKTLLPDIQQPLRPRNPLLFASQYSQDIMNLPKLKISKKRLKTKSRNVRKSVVSTDDEEFQSEEDLDTREYTQHRRDNVLSSVGLKTISAGKIGKFTSSTTFTNENIGINTSMDLNSGGLLDIDNEDVKEKGKNHVSEDENIIHKPVIQIKKEQQEKKGSDYELKGRNKNSANFKGECEVNKKLKRNMKKPAKPISASFVIDLELSDPEPEIIELSDVDQYLDVLEDQFRNEEDAEDVTNKNFTDSNDSNQIKIKNEKESYTEKTQSNVITEMLEFYEEEFEGQEDTNVNKGDEYPSYAHLFVPEDESDTSNDDIEKFVSSGNSDTSDLPNIGHFDHENQNDTKNDTSGDEGADDDTGDKIHVKRRTKKNKNDKLKSLAKHKRKKQLTMYDSYSDLSSNSESESGNSDDSQSDHDTSENFVASNDSIEFESESDSGDQLTKQEKEFESKSKPNDKYRKRKKRRVKSISSHDSMNIGDNKKRLKSLINDLKFSKPGKYYSDEPMVVVSVDSEDDSSKKEEKEISKQNLADSPLELSDSEVESDEKNNDAKLDDSKFKSNKTPPVLSQSDESRLFNSNEFIADHDCIRCDIGKKGNRFTEPCDRLERCNNCVQNGLTCGYSLDVFTKNIGDKVKNAIRREEVKRKKLAPKMIDNSLLLKLDETTRKKNRKI